MGYSTKRGLSPGHLIHHHIGHYIGHWMNRFVMPSRILGMFVVLLLLGLGCSSCSLPQVQAEDRLFLFFEPILGTGNFSWQLCSFMNSGRVALRCSSFPGGKLRGKNYYPGGLRRVATDRVRDQPTGSHFSSQHTQFRELHH